VPVAPRRPAEHVDPVTEIHLDEVGMAPQALGRQLAHHVEIDAVEQLPVQIIGNLPDGSVQLGNLLVVVVDHVRVDFFVLDALVQRLNLGGDLILTLCHQVKVGNNLCVRRRFFVLVTLQGTLGFFGSTLLS
jgi:hypothetical protein